MVSAKVIPFNRRDSNIMLSFFISEGSMAKRQEKVQTLPTNRLKIRLDDMDVISPLTSNQKIFLISTSRVRHSCYYMVLQAQVNHT